MFDFTLENKDSLKIISTDWNFDSDGDAELLSHKMIDLMLNSNGIGLAANQINLQKRVFVMGHNSHYDFPKPFSVFNPEIIERSNEQILNIEGCLSFPGLYLKLKRPTWIIAKYYDYKGFEKEIKLSGYAATCFQHEYDHLNGVCFVDKVSQMKLNLAMKKLRKQK
jgi:peptide deformylase